MIGYQIAVNAPLKNPLSYSPPDLTPPIQQIKRGDIVQVPLGKRVTTGVVLGTQELDTSFQWKSVLGFSNWPALPEPYLDWLLWIAEYYIYPLGQVVHLCLPPLSKEKGRKKTKIFPMDSTPIPTPILTKEQDQVFNAIREQKKFGVHYIYGVTGSGKTEVYMRLLQDVVEAGGAGLVLVPEISLTPQLMTRFTHRFPGQVAVLHSQLTDRERTDQWWAVQRGEKKVLVGARSAIFCPIPGLRMIILDEEHEPSYKQDEKLRYHARDAAIVLSQKLNCPLVLGSATPSLEAWKNIKEKKFSLHSMTTRVGNRPIPKIEIIDLRETRAAKKDVSENKLPFWLSQELYEAIQNTLLNNQQTALFLNRRGVANLVFCTACGKRFQCPDCEIGLTLHGKSQLVCHYCHWTEILKSKCPECHSEKLEILGLGTEAIERDLRLLLPSARLLRADRDEIQSRQDLDAFVSAVEKREVDILIGTQMIAKGLDFPFLTTVGILLADIGFNLPDFRAAERSIQLILQMAGRGGRHLTKDARVLVQTFNPEHSSLVAAEKFDLMAFVEQELAFRSQYAYPPYWRLAMIKVSSLDKAKGMAAAQFLANRGLGFLKANPLPSDLKILGPSPSPLGRIRNRYRFQILIKAQSSNALHSLLNFILKVDTPNGTKVQVDIDPMNMM